MDSAGDRILLSRIYNFFFSRNVCFRFLFDYIWVIKEKKIRTFMGSNQMRTFLPDLAELNEQNYGLCTSHHLLETPANYIDTLSTFWKNTFLILQKTVIEMQPLRRMDGQTDRAPL